MAEDGVPHEDRDRLREAVGEQLLEDEDVEFSRDAALIALRDFDHEGFVIDGREWDLDGWDHHFLMASWAIKRGVTQYRAAKVRRPGGARPRRPEAGARVIFVPRLAQAVMAWTKTVTRRVCSSNPRPPWYREQCGVRVDQLVTVQPGRGKPNIGRAQVLDVSRERLGNLDDGEARREGFADVGAFARTFADLYGTYDGTLEVWRVVIRAERGPLGADPAAPRFEFRMTTARPDGPQVARCLDCGWVAVSGKGTFERADTHVCSLGPRAGLARDESPAVVARSARSCGARSRSSAGRR